MSRTLLQKILYALSRAILKKYQPEIIAVTGTVGKTSTKEAIKTALAGHFNVRASFANYNNEVGVPLTIIGAESGEGSLIKWLRIMLRAWALLLRRDLNYPEILVLEMAADHPGDIDYLTRLAPPRVGVVTFISPAHLEFFKTTKKIAQEKQLVISRLPKEGLAVLNADNEAAQAMGSVSKAKVMTYGFGEGASVRIAEPFLKQENIGGKIKVSGMGCKILYGGAAVPVMLPGVVGRPHLYAAAAAAAIGLSKGFNLLEISERLRLFEGAPGRLKLLPGIKNTTLIDDSYNSSPAAAAEALDILGEVSVEEKDERIAVLGDMLELGEAAEEAHRQVGERVARLGFDFLVTVGGLAKFIGDEARKKGLRENQIACFNNAEEAGRFLQEKIEPGDVVLVKGSQGMRMEKIVKELMAEPLKAEELLVRQYGLWTF